MNFVHKNNQKCYICVQKCKIHQNPTKTESTKNLDFSKIPEKTSKICSTVFEKIYNYDKRVPILGAIGAPKLARTTKWQKKCDNFAYHTVICPPAAGARLFLIFLNSATRKAE